MFKVYSGGRDAKLQLVSYVVLPDKRIIACKSDGSYYYVYLQDECRSTCDNADSALDYMESLRNWIIESNEINQRKLT